MPVATRPRLEQHAGVGGALRRCVPLGLGVGALRLSHEPLLFYKDLVDCTDALVHGKA